MSPFIMGQIEPVDICGMIGKELARMHSLDVEFDRSPVLWGYVDKWAELAAGMWSHCFT